MRAFLSKMLGRLVFVILAILLVPLAALNRQIVTLNLDLLGWWQATPVDGLQVPLFMVIVVTLLIGFVAGWLISAMLRWKNTVQTNKAAKKQPIAAPYTQPHIDSENAKHLPDQAYMLENRDAQ